jgi:UDP-N-acetylmuramyl pentapeptide synthase
MKRALLDTAKALGGRLIGENLGYGAVSTDSRTLEAGALFVASVPPGARVSTSPWSPWPAATARRRRKA